MAFAAAVSVSAAQADETRAQCPALAEIDLAALSNLSFDVVAARQVLQAEAVPQLGDADTVLRFYTFSDGGRGVADTTHAVARHAKGGWHLARRRNASDPMAGHLGAADAATLAAALADRCLAREPDYAPRTIPRLGGGGETCFDGATFYLQIERAGMVRTIRHDCRARWRAGEIMLLLRNAVLAPD